MPRPKKNIEVERDELNRIAKELGEMRDTLLVMDNRVLAMNSYYAKTITVVNEQLSLIKATEEKIDAIYKNICVKTDTEVLELKKPRAVKKTTKSK